jgi:ABC-type bacteriocin/lantibiotic exporter with double-glycine peptidase domain
MVLAWHGRRLPLEEVREATGFGRDGVSGTSLLRAGQWFGLGGHGVRVEDLKDMDLLPAGAILHWRFQHFVVFERLTAGGIEILDPALGRRRVPMEQVGKCFTGAAFVFEPGPGFNREERRPRTGWSYLRRLRGHAGLIARILALTLLIQLLALALPVLMGLLVDRVVPRADLRFLQVLAMGLAALLGFSFITSVARAHLLLHLRTRLDVQLTQDFLSHLVDLPYSFFRDRSGGDVMSRLNSNSTIREIVTSGALTALLDGFLVSTYLFFVFLASPRIGMLVLALGAVRVGAFLATRGRLGRLMTELIEKQGVSEGYQMQMLAGIETLKASGAEYRAVEHWSSLYTDVLNVYLARGRLSAWVDSILDILALASPLAVLVYGGFLVLQGQLSLGSMLAANALAAGFLGPLSKLISTAIDLQLLDTYLERVNEVMEMPREQDPSRVRRAPRLEGRIELDKVSFRYSPTSALVVHEASVAVLPGQFVALVGRSGAGKSTLAHLLLGLNRPESGRVLFDGHDLSELDLRSVRSQIGVVPQHPYLFGASVRANIAMGFHDFPLARVLEAAGRARIHDEIAAMPLGYETPLAEGGTSISGGQRQRIAIARALIHRPAILLLDEATSALDTVTEEEIHRELSALRCTRIVIAHRLSTIRDADLILVMNQGRIVEQGTHEELLRMGGIYAELASRQLMERIES